MKMAPKRDKKRNSLAAKLPVGKNIIPKARKTDENLEGMTKVNLIEKVKALEDKLTQYEAINNLLKEKIIEFQSKSTVREDGFKESNSKETQTVTIDDEVKFPCKECIFDASFEEELRWHMDCEHEIGDPEVEYDYKCKLCCKKFEKKTQYRLHMKMNI